MVRVYHGGIYIDGASYLVSTNYAIKTEGATTAGSYTVRIRNGFATAATISVWRGASATNATRILGGYVLRGKETLTIPSVSLGPSESIYVRSSATGVIFSLDGYQEDEYEDHLSASLEVDGTTYAINTDHTIIALSAGESARGTVRVCNFGANSGTFRVLRGKVGSFATKDGIEWDTPLEPGGSIVIPDVCFGDDSVAAQIRFRASATGFSINFDGWQLEG